MNIQTSNNAYATSSQGRKTRMCAVTLLNLAEDESIFLKKGEILGHLEPCPITIEEIIKGDWPDSEESG